MTGQVVSVAGLDDIVRDATGRYLAPPQPVEPGSRPAGPWSMNSTICLWCDGDNPKRLIVRHSICPTCAKGWES